MTGSSRRPEPPPARGALGLPLVVATIAGLLASGYLVVVHFLGEAPVCGPVKGCETVTTSEYSMVLGIPIALLGFGLSLVLVACAFAWWRLADRRPLLALYALLLLATLAVAYLTYLELFVIHAICAWCVTYATTIVLSLVITGLALRRGEIGRA
jgi:uncharacterized membrane protein